SSRRSPLISDCTLRMSVNGGNTDTSTSEKYFSGNENAIFCTSAMASKCVRFIFQLPAISGFRAIERSYSPCSNTATPGNSLPSRNSSEAPPPVEMCENCSSDRPSTRTAAAESPPPTTLNAVESAMAAAVCRVPAANGVISNTPIGPFQNTVRAVASVSENVRTLSGPMSSPIQSLPISSTGTVFVFASAEKTSAATTSPGSTSLSPASRSNRLQVSSISDSSNEPPTSLPRAARNVKHIPPPTSNRSTFGNNASITASLSETFEPPSTTA